MEADVVQGVWIEPVEIGRSGADEIADGFEGQAPGHVPRACSVNAVDGVEELVLVARRR